MENTERKPMKPAVPVLTALEKCQLARKLRYPPIGEYIDAVVKGDEVQKQKYIEACLAVKAKYPKPQI